LEARRGAAAYDAQKSLSLYLSPIIFFFVLKFGFHSKRDPQLFFKIPTGNATAHLYNINQIPTGPHTAFVFYFFFPYVYHRYSFFNLRTSIGTFNFGFKSIK
jgi:hypothetical protein